MRDLKISEHYLFNGEGKILLEEGCKGGPLLSKL